MKPPPSSENDKQDREIIKLLQELGSLESAYPPELLTGRRAAFLAQLEGLGSVDVEEGLDPGDEEIVKLLGKLKSAKSEYPADLLAARRSAFLQQIGGAGTMSNLDKLRSSLRSIFQYKLVIPAVPFAKLKRSSLVVAGLMIAAFVGSLLFSRAEQSFKPSPSQGAASPTPVLPTGASEVSLMICQPDVRAPLCASRQLDPSQDLANQGNGAAQPAVSKDARSSYGAVYPARYVNDRRSDTSWVSDSPDSWIKIDLGKVTTINTVTFQKGRVGSAGDHNPGQFVIAAALSDVYADGNSSNDYTEYAQVFNSEQTGFSGTISPAETVRVMFPPVQARFVKITFEEAGAAIEEVGVFDVQSPEGVEQPTSKPEEDVPGVVLTPLLTDTLLPIDTATPSPTGTRPPTVTPTPRPTQTALPTDTPVSSAINTPIPSPTSTPRPSNTPTPLPTNTRRPTDTPTPLPTNTRRPTDTPTPFPTNTQRPTDTTTPVPTNPLPLDTPSPPTVEPVPASTDPIIITGSDQTLTFTCNGNAVEVRGHANTVTLLGSCSSITVTGNGNYVFWQYGSPVITNLGNDNIISQL